MRYAEVIYEGGAHSVISFDDVSEVEGALSEQHRRAIAGEAGGPAGHNAERVHKVIIYDDNPADLGADKLIPAGVVSSLVSGMAGNTGTVNMDQLVAALRDEVSPTYPVSQGKHVSHFKADGEELDLSFLDSNGGTN